MDVANYNHVLDLGLDPGQYGEESILVHAMIAALFKFFERDNSKKVTYDSITHDGPEWELFKALNRFFREVVETGDLWMIDDDLLTEKLCELVRLRGHMWT